MSDSKHNISLSKYRLFTVAGNGYLILDNSRKEIANNENDYSFHCIRCKCNGNERSNRSFTHILPQHIQQRSRYNCNDSRYYFRELKHAPTSTIRAVSTLASSKWYNLPLKQCKGIQRILDSISATSQTRV